MNEFRFLQVRLTPDLYEGVSAAAWRRRQSMTKFVTELLTVYLEAEQSSGVVAPPDIPGQKKIEEEIG